MGLSSPFIMLAFMLAFMLPSGVHGFHFYLEAGAQVCLTEDLPDQTMVVGEYKALSYNKAVNSYYENPKAQLNVIVQDYTGSDILNVKGDNHDIFAFTTSEPGDHVICLGTDGNGWFGGDVEKLKVTLSLTIGDAGNTKIGKQESLDEMTQKIRELNSKVTDIRRQQDYQKEQEERFRDTAERVNSRVVWFILLQITILVLTTVWQMRHLTVFLKSKKVA